MRTKPYTEAELKKKTKAELADALRDINNPVFGNMLSLSNMDEADLIRKILEEQAASSSSATGAASGSTGTPTTPSSTSGGGSTTSSAGTSGTAGGTSPMSSTPTPSGFVQCPWCSGMILVAVSDYPNHLVNTHPDKLGLVPTAASPATPASPPSGGTTATAMPPETPSGSGTTTSKVKAPSFKGMSKEDALRKAWREGFDIDRNDYLETVDDDVDEGTVLGQKPASGSDVDPDQIFKLEISKKKQPADTHATATEPIPTPIPEVASGSTLSYAQAMLRSHGFTSFDSTSEPDQLVRKGRLIRVEPDPGGNPKKAILVLSEGGSSSGVKGWFSNWVHNE